MFGRRFKVDGDSGTGEVLAFERSRMASSPNEVSGAVKEIFFDLIGARQMCCIDRVVAQANRFDSPAITAENVVIAPGKVDISAETTALLEKAIERVFAFHEAQKRVVFGQFEPIDGGFRWLTRDPNDPESFEGQIARPIKRVGIYVPGGRASYPSSVIMNAVPALVAGVQELVMATPAGADGELMPEVEWIAHRLGIQKIIKVGGAAAVAALAAGIEGSIEPVDFIAGPGNKYVNEAKKMVWGTVGVDMQAGPSEVAVVVDDSSEISYAVADLLTQIEHAPDNVGRVYCFGGKVASLFESELANQVANLDRKAIVAESLQLAALIVFEGASLHAQAAECINAFAPEHLSIQTQNPDELCHLVRNAGSIAVGPAMAQSFGDYVTGPSHTLPTSGGARFSSPNSILTFMKFSSYSSASEALAAEIGPIAAGFAALEGFGGHRTGAELRLKKGNNK